MDRDRVAEIGLSVEKLQDIVDRMKRAKFGVIFFGMGLSMTRGKHMNSAGILNLAAEMNAFTKFVCMPMRGHGNVTGADVVLRWTTGYPFGISLSRGYPRFNPGEFSTADVLLRGDNDATLVLGADPGATMPQPAIDHLARTPTIVLDPKVTHTSRLARVHITTAVSGVSARERPIAWTRSRCRSGPLSSRRIRATKRSSTASSRPWRRSPVGPARARTSRRSPRRASERSSPRRLICLGSPLSRAFRAPGPTLPWL